MLVLFGIALAPACLCIIGCNTYTNVEGKKMSVIAVEAKRELDDFVQIVLEESQLAFDVFRETGTITANGTVGFVERVPGQEPVSYTHSESAQPAAKCRRGAL